MSHLIVLKLCFAFSLTLLFHYLLQSVAMPLDISSKFVSNNFVFLSCYVSLFLLLPSCFFLQHFTTHLVCSINIKTPPLFHFLSKHFTLSSYFRTLCFFFFVFCSKHHAAPKIRFACTIFTIVNPST